MTSPTIDGLSADAEVLFWRLTVAVDDYGRFNAEPSVVLARCFPLRVGTRHPAEVAFLMVELAEADLVSLYRHGERLYGLVVNWFKYQRRRDSKSKHPSPEGSEIVDLRQFAASCGGSRRVAARARAHSRAVSREPWAVSREPRAVSREPQPSGLGGEAPPPAAAAVLPVVAFRIPGSIAEALARAPRLGQARPIQRPGYWQAVVRAFPGVDYAKAVLEAEAWMVANPAKAPRSDYPRFLHGWIKRTHERGVGSEAL